MSHTRADVVGSGTVEVKASSVTDADSCENVPFFDERPVSGCFDSIPEYDMSTSLSSRVKRGSDAPPHPLTASTATTVSSSTTASSRRRRTTYQPTTLYGDAGVANNGTGGLATSLLSDAPLAPTASPAPTPSETGSVRATTDSPVRTAPRSVKSTGVHPAAHTGSSSHALAHIRRTTPVLAPATAPESSAQGSVLIAHASRRASAVTRLPESDNLAQWQDTARRLLQQWQQEKLVSAAYRREYGKLRGAAPQKSSHVDSRDDSQIQSPLNSPATLSIALPTSDSEADTKCVPPSVSAAALTPLVDPAAPSELERIKSDLAQSEENQKVLRALLADRDETIAKLTDELRMVKAVATTCPPAASPLQPQDEPIVTSPLIHFARQPWRGESPPGSASGAATPGSLNSLTEAARVLAATTSANTNGPVVRERLRALSACASASATLPERSGPARAASSASPASPQTQQQQQPFPSHGKLQDVSATSSGGGSGSRQGSGSRMSLSPRSTTSHPTAMNVSMPTLERSTDGIADDAGAAMHSPPAMSPLLVKMMSPSPPSASPSGARLDVSSSFRRAQPHGDAAGGSPSSPRGGHLAPSLTVTRAARGPTEEDSRCSAIDDELGVRPKGEESPSLLTTASRLALPHVPTGAAAASTSHVAALIAGHSVAPTSSAANSPNISGVMTSTPAQVTHAHAIASSGSTSLGEQPAHAPGATSGVSDNGTSPPLFSRTHCGSLVQKRTPPSARATATGAAMASSVVQEPLTASPPPSSEAVSSAHVAPLNVAEHHISTMPNTPAPPCRDPLRRPSLTAQPQPKTTSSPTFTPGPQTAREMGSVGSAGSNSSLPALGVESPSSTSPISAVTSRRASVVPAVCTARCLEATPLSPKPATLKSGCVPHMLQKTMEEDGNKNDTAVVLDAAEELRRWRREAATMKHVL